MVVQPFALPVSPRANGVRPDMSIVLVCWNNKTYLEPCLESICNSALQFSYDIVVVDNGSKDGSQAMLREKYPQIALIQNDHNAGLSRATNQGIEATNGRFVLLLNNDTLVNGPSLNTMVEFLEKNPDAGAVGGKLVNADGSFQAAGSFFPSFHEEFLISTRLGALISATYPDVIPGNEVKAVDWLGSACLLVRREVFERVGLLDEQYFIYGDEADLQYRLKQAGWKAYFLPGVTTLHYGGRSMDRWRRRKMVYRGKMLFFKKNYGQVKSGLLRFMIAGLTVIKLIIWGVAYMNPRWRERAQRELNSNLEVLQLCWKLE